MLCATFLASCVSPSEKASPDSRDSELKIPFLDEQSCSEALLLVAVDEGKNWYRRGTRGRNELTRGSKTDRLRLLGTQSPFVLSTGVRTSTCCATICCTERYAVVPNGGNSPSWAGIVCHTVFQASPASCVNKFHSPGSKHFSLENFLRETRETNVQSEK